MLQNFDSVNCHSTSLKDVMEKNHKVTPHKENCLTHFEIFCILKDIPVYHGIQNWNPTSKKESIMIIKDVCMCVKYV